MVKRGHRSYGPQASEGEAQHGPFCWIRRIGQGDQRLHCGWHGQDRAGSEGSERARGSCARADESRLPYQANWLGSRTIIAMALQRSGRSELAGDLCRDRHMRAVLFEVFVYFVVACVAAHEQIVE